MSNIKQLEGGRAAYAYKCAEEAAKESQEFARKYKNGVVRKIPMMIKTNGLGNTLAFARSKGDLNGSDEKKAWGKVYKQITDWLEQHQNKYLLEGIKDKKDDLVGNVIQLNSAQYRACTVEVLALFNWLRRFAEGLIDG